MKENEGAIDRLLRATIGILAVCCVFIGPKTPWGWLGVIPLVTGLAGFCPLYSLVGIRTCSIKQ